MSIVQKVFEVVKNDLMKFEKNKNLFLEVTIRVLMDKSYVDLKK